MPSEMETLRRSNAQLFHANRTQRERLEELEETIRQLREERNGERFPDWVPYLTKREAQVLRILIDYREVTTELMQSAVYDRGAIPASDNLLRVFIKRLRTKLLPFGIIIETIYTRGYRITTATKAKLKGA